MGGWMKERISYLDGLRGLAIILVLGFHSYSRWPEIVPYGDKFQDVAIFEFGWLGVQLFFLISGFVIFMTLDKTETFQTFLYKRWLRLFPGMLLATMLIYITSFLLDSRPAGTPGVYSWLPGLTFIDPGWWSKLLGINVGVLEGAFWSLYVEFKFYIIAGIIYFTVGRKFLAAALFLLFIGSIALSYFSGVTENRFFEVFNKISIALSLMHFGWFSSGAFFYLYYQKKESCYFGIAISVGLLSSCFVGPIDAVFAAMLMTAIFAASLRVSIIQKFLMNRVLLFFGFISYPLYLIHENALISMIVQFSGYFPWFNMLLLPLLPIIFLSLTAYLMAYKYEKKIRVFIERLSF